MAADVLTAHYKKDHPDLLGQQKVPDPEVD
jgi:hypothetical protein